MIPKVSVVLPVKMAGAASALETLAPAVKSVLMQTMRDFELIIVDDGGGLTRTECLSRFQIEGGVPGRSSSLSVKQKLTAYARLRIMRFWKECLRETRVKIIHLPPTGIVGALNAGIAEARAPYIARMDADDVCSPRRLELQLGYMKKNPECSLLGSLVGIFPRRRLKDGMRHYERWLNSVVSEDDINRELFVESPFAHPSVMFRRDEALALGGYRDMGWPEDYDMWLRFAQNGLKMAKLPEVLLFWRDGEGRLSRTSASYSAESFRNVKAHFLKEWRLKGVNSVQVWGAGRDGKTWAKLLMRTGFDVLQFIDIDKKKVGGRACGGSSRIGPVDRLQADGPVPSGWPSSAGGIPVVWPGDIIKGTPILCAVGVKGAREQIRDYLRLEGFKEPEEFMFLL